MRYFRNRLRGRYGMLYSLHTVVHHVSSINLLWMIRASL
ncbi:hypothetical protein XU18_0814 [Perkinsela sp. CCAP 1560/4]|nr:hypothetical protein XU18_0814 [Perkinsela sp. CCAP 1560/4]|eukprot:KNH00515.1 hypothetical protein XU18_0814 [Perkinsela sp. CCAP 1560/4]